MRYKLYTKTEKAWDAMFSSIQKAKSSILLEMYIFSDDTAESHDFMNILCEKARMGLKVKLVLNSFKSLNVISSQSITDLRNAGAEVLFFKNLLRYTHRKILIIDEKIAFLGGINIYKFFKKWQDLQIKMEGKVVKHVLQSFARIYKFSGGNDQFVLKHEKELKTPKGKVRFIEHLPPKNSFRMGKFYKDKIKSARKKILIVTPYLMPNGWMMRGLKNALKRDVEVEIIMPRFTSNPKVANVPNYIYMHKLWKHGAKIFLTKEMTHSKMMIVDEEEGILGSQNIDLLSFDFNMESGISFEDPSMISELQNIILEWKKDAVLYSPEMRSILIHNYFSDNLLDFSFNVFEKILKVFNRFTKVF